MKLLSNNNLTICSWIIVKGSSMIIFFLMYTFVKSLLKVKNKLVSPVLNNVKECIGLRSTLLSQFNCLNVT